MSQHQARPPPRTLSAAHLHGSVRCDVLTTRIFCARAARAAIVECLPQYPQALPTNEARGSCLECRTRQPDPRAPRALRRQLRALVVAAARADPTPFSRYIVAALAAGMRAGRDGRIICQRGGLDDAEALGLWAAAMAAHGTWIDEAFLTARSSTTRPAHLPLAPRRSTARIGMSVGGTACAAAHGRQNNPTGHADRTGRKDRQASVSHFVCAATPLLPTTTTRSYSGFAKPDCSSGGRSPLARLHISNCDRRQQHSPMLRSTQSRPAVRANPLRPDGV